MRPRLSYRPVPYSAISPYLRRALLVAEDDTFYEHKGVDVDALKDAWDRRKITHGGSTITQQLAKNLYLSPSRNPLPKLKEYFIARSLEKHSFQEAHSRALFASGVSASQAALLAGSLPNPRLMNPAAPNKRLRWRQRMIVSRTGRLGSSLRRASACGEEAASARHRHESLQQTQTDTTTSTQ